MGQEFIEFDAISKKSKNISEPLITISKFGIITFNLKLISELNLSEGIKVSFL